MWKFFTNQGREKIQDVSSGGGGGVTDHGALTGLADNDHPQYALAGTSVYTVTNTTTDRTFNANSYTTDELADVLGTLIADLKISGVID